MSASTIMAIFINFGILGSAPLLQDAKSVINQIHAPTQRLIGIEQKLEKTMPDSSKPIQNLLLQRTFHNSA